VNPNPQQEVIEDFGRQWTTYTDNSGFYGSLDLFRDVIEPLIPVRDFLGKRIAEVGAGTGRISAMLCEAGASEVTALEPSVAYDVLRNNLRQYGKRVKCIQATGDQLPDGQYDMVLSIGVLHHIPDPMPVVHAAYRALKPRGQMLIWLYGLEGNDLYLRFLMPFRALTKRMPHRFNAAASHVLDIPLVAYMIACRYLRLPLYQYMRSYIGKLTADKRRLVIYDQLNPEWAKYYRRDEAEQLLAAAGFQGVRSHHRGGYSWTVVGTKVNG
jgi:2-polyprenyl-3-methyl-5-hydroxy-6-metoxy-1,4-benzoquinol methylase